MIGIKQESWNKTGEQLPFCTHAPFNKTALIQFGFFYGLSTLGGHLMPNLARQKLADNFAS